MLGAKKSLIHREVEEGTGASVDLEEDQAGLQSGLRLWFADLPQSHSPIVTLRPLGLHGFRAKLGFGNFAADTIEQMKLAGPEDVQLARALVASITNGATVTLAENQTLGDWRVGDRGFTLVAEKRNILQRLNDDALAETCRELVIPMLAAMAELYGYDPVEEPLLQEGEIEGALTVAAVRKRERSPRNRLLALRLHGSTCKVCGTDPQDRYDAIGSLIEIHHIQPLSSLGEPQAYDPATDLIPLCPNCHRAVHMKRPLPWTPDELRERLRLG
jgi:5-methylcytosine-specific restriction protein A